MAYIVICVVALAASGLTLLTGFGLGTLLMPAFAIFFPIAVAVAAAAIVHLANNLFQIILIGKYANLKVLALFAVPAAIFAVGGALLLNRLANLPELTHYTLAGHVFMVTPVKIIIAVLIAGFGLFELIPHFQDLSFAPRYTPLGGALAGFFGGLSGHQGAFRTAFLVRAGLSRDAFIATSACAAVVVDASRLVVYGVTFLSGHFRTLQGSGTSGLIIAGCVAAFVGAFIGSRLMKKVTMHTVRILVGLLLLVVAVGLASGLL